MADAASKGEAGYFHRLHFPLATRLFLVLFDVTMNNQFSSAGADEKGQESSSESTCAPSFISRVAYKDRRSAVEWLEKAFGFKTTLLATDPDGNVVHAEMKFGNGCIHLGSEWEKVKAPGSVGGANTQTISVQLDNGIDDHCERARAAGATIVQEPQDQFHGDRTYRVIDPQGHTWSFSEKLREVTVEEMEAAVPGMKVWTPK
jgi:uncharacterized glyoxalase superfamily protein PhnB